MKKFFLVGAAFLALASPAVAQNTTCADRPVGDESNACANTRFVGANSGATVNVMSVGAKCDWNGTTGTDDTAAIQTALNTYKAVLIPRNCAVASTLTFGNLAFATLTGINSASSTTNINTGSSVLVAMNAALPVISVVTTIPGLVIQNLGITRSVAATAGGNGIQFNGYNDNPILDNVEVEKQYVGLDLTASGYGILRNSFIHDSVSDNILCDGPRMTIAVQCQWYLTDILSSRAGTGGTGWNYNVLVPPTGAIDNKMTMGTWLETKSFSAASGGANFKGNVNVRLQGVRISGGFYGESGGAELNFDTFNSAPGPHQISDVFVEINTNGTCVNFTGNNATIVMTGGSVIGCNTSGIVNNATQLVVSGTQILNNTTFGIVNGGVALVTGSNLGNNTSGPFSNSSTYIGRSNTPTTANTVIPIAEGGTNTATAIGSPGSIVINGGALGTPSSGTVTNLTGTASININGTVGATSPSTGAFTTLAASTSITATGNSANLLAAGRLGATTPAFNVDASTATSITGLNIKSAASGGNLAVSVISSSTNEALIVDAKGSGAINFGTTSSGNVNIFRQSYIGGTSLSPASGTQLTVSQNTGGSPATSAAGNILGQFIAADSAIGTVTIDTFANQSNFALRYAGGTQASKTTTNGLTNTFSFSAQGWDTTAYATGVAIDFITTATNWSATQHGMAVRFRTVADTASATLTERVRIGTGLMVGNTTDPGVGVVSATGGYVSNGLAGITTVCTIAVGNVLTFTLGIITAKGGVAGCT